MKKAKVIRTPAVIAVISFLIVIQAYADDTAVTTNSNAWVTVPPAVFAVVSAPATNLQAQSSTGGSVAPGTTRIFDHFLPESLDNLVWTNFIAHTNGRDMNIWSSRSHPRDWPAKPPLVTWNTNSLIWGLKGFTAISPCWEVESAPGQVPVTAFTRRHAYTRGHGMGRNGFNTNFAGKKIWFLTANNSIVEVTVVRDVVRSIAGGDNRDYTILLFNKDLPNSIEPMRVASPFELPRRYFLRPGVPHPLFKTEQSGMVSTDIQGMSVNTWKGGDSGSPDMLPLPDELVFVNGRSTSCASPEMQADMDKLCQLEHLDPQEYQLQWFSLLKYPLY